MSALLSTFGVLILAGCGLLAGLWAYTRHLGRDVERLVPRIGQMQQVRGGRLHYLDTGPRAAQPLVLIHGLSGQLQHFTYALAEPLARDFRVIAVDRPGCGYSERDSDARAALPEQARMIWELLDALELRNPVLVGHSLGGAVALAMALARPAETGALALLCPLTHPEPRAPGAFDGLAIASPLMRRLVGHTIAVPMGKKNAEVILAQIFTPESCPDDFLTRAGGALGLRPKAFITASADFMAARPGAEAMAARYDRDLKTQGGVLFGASDAILSPARHGSPMAAHGLAVETVEGRGHMIPLTAPEACLDFIRRMAALADPDRGRGDAGPA